MKRFVALVATMVSAFACVCLMAGCSGAQKAEDAPCSSGSIFSYNGTLYYSGFGYVPSTNSEVQGATKIPIETSNFLIYQDMVYYTVSPDGTSGDSPVKLRTCKLDGSDDNVVSTDIAPQSCFYMVDGNLVYEHFDKSMADPEGDGWTNDCDYWVKLDPSQEGAKPQPLSKKKNIQVVAANSSHLFYVKGNATDYSGKNVYCAGLDLSDERQVYKGSITNSQCAVDQSGNLLISDQRGKKVTTFDKDLNQLTTIETGYDSLDDSLTTLQVTPYGVFVSDPKNKVTAFDSATGESTEYELKNGSDYYLEIQYADDKQVVYVSSLNTESSDDDSPAADNTALYQQNWDGSNATQCGTWFES